jgi:hypothetical protein
MLIAIKFNFVFSKTKPSMVFLVLIFQSSFYKAFNLIQIFFKPIIIFFYSKVKQIINKYQRFLNRCEIHRHHRLQQIFLLRTNLRHRRLFTLLYHQHRQINPRFNHSYRNHNSPLYRHHCRRIIQPVISIWARQLLFRRRRQWRHRRYQTNIIHHRRPISLLHRHRPIGRLRQDQRRNHLWPSNSTN